MIKMVTTSPLISCPWSPGRSILSHCRFVRMILSMTSKIGWLSEKMTHFGTMNHWVNESPREWNWVFTPPYTFYSSSSFFWTLFRLNRLEIIKYPFSKKKKYFSSRNLFLFSDPHFGQFINACQKLQFSLRAFSKWAEWRHLTVREEKSDDRAKKNFMKIFLKKRNCDC